MPAVGLLIIIGYSMGLFAKDSPLQEWQTLIAGLVALLAAWITVTPVWLQLKRMGVQSDTMFHEFLEHRLEETSERARRVRALMEGFQGPLSIAVYEHFEFGRSLNAEWAFDQEHSASHTAGQLRAYWESHRDAPRIHNAIGRLLDELRLVEDCLQAIHRPVSLTTVGDLDEPLTAAQEAELVGEANVAEKALPERSAELSRAVRAVIEAFAEDLRSTRERARRIEARLLS